jgi:hypothetical protein
MPSKKPTATVKSIDPAAFMDQASSDYVLAVRVLHAGSIIMTHAVGGPSPNAVNHSVGKSPRPDPRWAHAAINTKIKKKP